MLSALIRTLHTNLHSLRVSDSLRQDYPMHWCHFADVVFNTLRSRQNGRHFTDGIFKRIYLNENVRIWMKFPSVLLFMVQLKIRFQIMTCAYLLRDISICALDKLSSITVPKIPVMCCSFEIICSFIREIDIAGNSRPYSDLCNVFIWISHIFSILDVRNLPCWDFF